MVIAPELHIVQLAVKVMVLTDASLDYQIRKAVLLRHKAKKVKQPQQVSHEPLMHLSINLCS